MNTQRTVSQASYRCAAANRHVQVQIKPGSRTTRHVPQACSGIGDCQRGVVRLVSGITYEVDWQRCRFCSDTENQ
ncbi:hypothetical protein [Candidatus Electronema sp. JM]|uniref:hypothetical protein n=1 Tax=Candidatus Electronema sp. JM TaxID=3401571 RepID=UPI003AA8C3A5